MKHQFYANAHHQCKEYIKNFHLPNVETNLKISSPVKQKDIPHFVILQFHTPSLRQNIQNKKLKRYKYQFLDFTYQWIFL